MDTEVIRVDVHAGVAEVVRRAADVLSSGGLVAFPTETVYGVGARADDSAAVERLRKVKSRPPDKPFTVHIGSPAETARFAPAVTGVTRRFIRKAWPGPLTLIIPVDDPMSAPGMRGLNGSAMAAMYYENTIGMRCPDDPVTRSILQTVEAPVIAASANRGGHPPPLTGEDVLKDLGGQIDLLIDAGRTRYSKPSTIVQVRGSSYELVREGVYDARIVEEFSTLRLLLVCTGNTCRSPMAAALARKVLAERLGCAVGELALRGVAVTSAGTAGGGGGASPHAVTVMASRGIDLSDHVSVVLTREIVRDADFIYVMTQSHRDVVLNMVPSAEDRVRLLLDGRDIHDPIGGSENAYEQCARMAEEGLRARLQEVLL